MENPFKLYSKIFISKAWKCCIFQTKTGEVFFANDSEVRPLPIYKIVDESNNMVRFYNLVEGKKKWGIIHIKGHIIIPPDYDYVSQVMGDQYFRVFTGQYKWSFNKHSSNLFYKHLDTNSWNGDQYKGTLGKGKWGVINMDKKIVVPIEYEWVEFADDLTVCCNVGGSGIIKWYDGDGKKNVLSIADGLWKIIYLGGLNIETDLAAYPEVIQDFQAKFSQNFSTPHNYIFSSNKWETIHKFTTGN